MADQAKLRQAREGLEEWAKRQYDKNRPIPMQVTKVGTTEIYLSETTTTSSGNTHEIVVNAAGYFDYNAGDIVMVQPGRSLPGWNIIGHVWDDGNTSIVPLKARVDTIQTRSGATDLTLIDQSNSVTLSDLAGQAPADAKYVVTAADAGLSAEVVMPTSATVLGTDGSNEPIAAAAADILAHINVEDGADVTDATNVDAAGAVMEADFNAKGDLLSASADNTPAILSIDTDGYVLTADSGEATGMKWAESSGASSLTVVNSSGGTRSANDVVLLQYDATLGYEAITTTTAAKAGVWAVVTTGGANGADIVVVRSGTEITVAYAGAAPSAGDFLVTSTTAGSAGGQAYMSPEVFAVCTANGAGNTVEATLLCNTQYRTVASDYDIFYIKDHSGCLFSAQCDGAPSGGVVTYKNESGNPDSIVPDTSATLCFFVLHNTTAGEYALYSAVNTGAKQIAALSDYVSTVNGWANNDNIQVNSLTNTATLTGGEKFFDFQVDDDAEAVIPATARALEFYALVEDSSAMPAPATFHPYEADNTSKRLTVQPQDVNDQITLVFSVPLINGRFCFTSVAGGSGSKRDKYRIRGYWEAVP